jgi:DNA repair protein RadC
MAVSQLTKFRGIGNAKAVSISAALELSRRRRFENSENLSKITSSQNAFELLRPLIVDLPHEEFWIVFLNNSHVFLGCQQLSKGGISQTTVDIRLALKQALLHESTAIILAHNHPSGTLKPSASDHEITKKFRKGCDILDVKLLDHLIVTENSYFSFADNGDL